MDPKLVAGLAIVLLGIVSVTGKSTTQEGDHETSSTEKPSYPEKEVIFLREPLPNTTPVLSDSTAFTRSPHAPTRRPFISPKERSIKPPPPPPKQSTSTTPETIPVPTNNQQKNKLILLPFDGLSNEQQADNPSMTSTRRTPSTKILPKRPSSEGSNNRNRPPIPKRIQPPFLEGNIIDTVKETLDEISKRYPPIQKMFQDDTSFLDRLSRAKSNLLSALKNCEVEGSQAFNMSRVSENDAMRILDDIQRASHDIKEKLTAAGGLTNLTLLEINEMPVSVLPILSDIKIAELRYLDQDKLDALCNKLMATGASPWNLQSMMESGINCIHMPTSDDFVRNSQSQPKVQQRQTGYSVSKVMMKYIRQAQTVESWNSNMFITVAKKLKDVITASDITMVPEAIIRESLKNISMVEFPFKSQVRTIIDKASAVFQTPSSWSETFITDIGQLLDKVDIHAVDLLRNEALYNIAGDLLVTGIKNNLTKLVLANSIHTVFKKTEQSHMEIYIPWLRGEIEFIQSQDIQSVLDVFMSNDLSHVPFTTAEKHMFADKVEQMIMSNYLGNNTDEYVVAFRDIIEGFSNEFLEWLPDHLAPNITQKVPFKQISKARRIKRKLKRFLRKERLSAREAVMVFSGLDLSDLDNMTTAELLDILPMLRTMDLPFHIGSKIVKKIERSLLSENQTGCSMAFWKLGRLAVYVSPEVLDELTYVPIPLDRAADQDECPQNDIEILSSQAYAVVDNVMNNIARSGNNGTVPEALSASLLRRLGRFVGGLTVQDIESMPLDTELLSIIEVLSDYEDELTSGQNEAIVEKIRGYFDWHNRNTITEASDIMIAQIGRFLQYLNPEFELPKFPTTLRPSISREIGKSSLLKISSGRRQALLLFALKNAPTDDGSTTDLMLQQTITNSNLEDLGSLKCGLTTGIISKMSTDAIDLNLEDFMNCPLKDDIFEALIKKAVDLNINRLTIRQGIGSIGPALQYLSEDDSANLNTRELASITSFTTSSMDHLDAIFEQTEKNGFTLENSSHNKGLRKRRRTKFVNKLYAALKQYQNQIDCPLLLFMGTALPDVTDEMDVNFARCSEAVGTLSNWENTGARKMLKSILRQQGQSLNTNTLTAMAPDMIAQTAGLLKGLTKTEMNHLNFSDINTLAAVGNQDLSVAQLQIGFNTWKSNQLSGDSDGISEDDLVSMQNFACGMQTSDIQNELQVGTVRRCLGALGRRRCFNRDQMEALTKKLADSMNSTPISNWKNYLVYEMGHLIGGLQRDDFQQLTKQQLQIIEPSVISNLAPEKVQDFTVGQLLDATPNQGAAFTTMQRSFMSQEQLEAIGKEFINGAGQNNMANCSVVVVLLSLLRQLIVYL